MGPQITLTTVDSHVELIDYRNSIALLADANLHTMLVVIHLLEDDNVWSILDGLSLGIGTTRIENDSCGQPLINNGFEVFHGVLALQKGLHDRIVLAVDLVEFDAKLVDEDVDTSRRRTIGNHIGGVDCCSEGDDFEHDGISVCVVMIVILHSFERMSTGLYKRHMNTVAIHIER